MIIGCPTEVKAGETRVALTPQWSKTLTEQWPHSYGTDTGRHKGGI